MSGLFYTDPVGAACHPVEFKSDANELTQKLTKARS